MIRLDNIYMQIDITDRYDRYIDMEDKDEQWSNLPDYLVEDHPPEDPTIQHWINAIVIIMKVDMW